MDDCTKKWRMVAERGLMFRAAITSGTCGRSPGRSFERFS